MIGEKIFLKKKKSHKGLQQYINSKTAKYFIGDIEI